MKISIITIKVNGHDVKVTTDQEITQTYIDWIVQHVKSIENETGAILSKLVHKDEVKK